jgi:hypothetical protein
MSSERPEVVSRPRRCSDDAAITGSLRARDSHKKPKTRPGTSEIAEAAFLLEYKALKGLPLGRANGRSRAIMVSVRGEEGLEAPAPAPEDPELEADTSLLTRVPAEWSRASDAVQAHFAFEAMRRAGPVLDLTAWLSNEVNALAYAKSKPLQWIRERITFRLKEAFKRPVAFVLVIEEEFNVVTRTSRLHVHGLIQLDPRRKTRKLARAALRQALGTWEGEAKKRQIWLRRDPDCGWPAYFTKRCFLATRRMRARMKGFGADYRWVPTFDGPVLTMTNDVRAVARQLHVEARRDVLDARNGRRSAATPKMIVVNAALPALRHKGCRGFHLDLTASWLLPLLLDHSRSLWIAGLPLIAYRSRDPPWRDCRAYE